MADSGEQMEIPGLETPRNDRVHRAAKAYYKAMQLRKAELENEVAAHATLLRIMLEEGVEIYNYNGIEARIDVTKKVKVKNTEPSKEE